MGRAAEKKAAAVEKAKTAVNMAGKEFGYIKEQFVVRWTEEAIEVGDDNWAALTEEVPDLCDHIGVVKSLLQREDAKCVAMIKALDLLRKLSRASLRSLRRTSSQRPSPSRVARAWSRSRTPVKRRWPGTKTERVTESYRGHIVGR